MYYIKKATTANSNILIKRSELNNLKLYQKDINELVEQGYLEKVRQGWVGVWLEWQTWGFSSGKIKK